MEPTYSTSKYGVPVKIPGLQLSSCLIAAIVENDRCPNTLSLVKGAPNPENGRKLIEYLLSPAVETALANGPSAQIPLGKKVTIKARVKTANDVKPMDVDFQKAADAFDTAAQFIRKEFLR